MAGESIIREPTESEKQNFVDIMKPSYDTNFIKEMRKKEFEYAKKYQPFCRRCCKLDFEDAVAQLKLNITRFRGQNKVDSLVNIGSMDKYADKKRFELLMESEANDQIVVAGRREPRVVGWHVDYKCNVRGCNITVDMPLDVYDKWKGIKPADKK